MKHQLLEYYGLIVYQEYVKEFDWQEKHFYQYLIHLEDCEGTFLINRADDLEQALLGGKIQFNLNEDGNQITKYKIAGYEESKLKIKKRIKNK